MNEYTLSAVNTTDTLREVISISYFWKKYNECQNSDERIKMIKSERVRLGLDKTGMAPYGNFK